MGGFKPPACPTFLNIFHPYDPVAYRIESLVDKKFSSLRPVVIPHHMGRKRMHLELKDTMTRVGGDIKAKVMESLKATMGAVYHVAGTLTGQDGGGVVDQQYQEERSPSPSGSEVEDTSALETTCINQGARVDHVLQEAPMESFNEYVFALASHLCYWESEDTMLLILRQIYSGIGVFSDDRLGGGGSADPASSLPPFKHICHLSTWCSAIIKVTILLLSAALLPNSATSTHPLFPSFSCTWTSTSSSWTPTSSSWTFNKPCNRSTWNGSNSPHGKDWTITTTSNYGIHKITQSM